MSDVECPRCGAAMKRDDVCPVCETPWSVSSARAQASVRPENASRTARWWTSGQLAVAVAAGCFLAALFLPLMSGIHLLDAGALHRDVSVRPLDLVLGSVPALRGQLSSWLLPGAAAFLLSLLQTRRTGAAMTASRMLVVVVSLAPVVSVAMPFLRMKKSGVTPTPGAALGLVIVGVVMGIVGGLRFGQGVPEASVKRRDPDDEDDEE